MFYNLRLDEPDVDIFLYQTFCTFSRFLIGTPDNATRNRSGHCLEFLFDTCSTQQEIVSDVFIPTRNTLFGLGEGWCLGKVEGELY